MDVKESKDKESGSKARATLDSAMHKLKGPQPAQSMADVAQAALTEHRVASASAEPVVAAAVSTVMPAAAARLTCTSCAQLEAQIVLLQQAAIRNRQRGTRSFIAGNLLGALVVLALLRNRIPLFQALSQSRRLQLFGAIGFVVTTVLLSVFKKTNK